MRELAQIALVLSVSACGSVEYVDRPLEVKVPVPVPCVQPGDVPPAPVYPLAHLETGASDGEVIGAMWAEIEQRGAVERQLRAILGACIQ